MYLNPPIRRNLMSFPNIAGALSTLLLVPVFGMLLASCGTCTHSDFYFARIKSFANNPAQLDFRYLFQVTCNMCPDDYRFFQPTLAANDEQRIWVNTREHSTTPKGGVLKGTDCNSAIDRFAAVEFSQATVNSYSICETVDGKGTATTFDDDHFYEVYDVGAPCPMGGTLVTSGW